MPTKQCLIFGLFYLSLSFGLTFSDIIEDCIPSNSYDANLVMDEICGNGIDDDGDGLIDCLDSDCCDELICDGSLPDLSLQNTFIVIPFCNDLFINICNDGLVDFSGAFDIAFYDMIPEFVGAQLVNVITVNATFLAGDCATISVDISFSDLDTYYFMINDDGSVLPPFDVSATFPVTDIHECDFENNLGFYLPQDFPAINVNADLCPGGQYILPDGEIVFNSGIYTDTITSNFQCDSIIVTNLTIATTCVEDCFNGIDDDGDGLVDIWDDECDCLDNLGIVNLIPNGDFETINGCCDNLDDQSLVCMSDWILLSGTPDYYNPNCALDGSNANVTINNGALGGGATFFQDGSQDFERLGVCLSNTLTAGISYQFSLDIANDVILPPTFPEHDLILYGVPSCSDILQYGQGDICDLQLPQEELARIDLDQLNSNWSQLSFNFIPTIDIEAIYFFVSCDGPVGANTLYYVIMDNLAINEVLDTSIEDEIVVSGSLCGDDIMLTVELDPTAQYQWYINQIPLGINGDEHILDLTNFNPSSSTEFYAYVVFPNGQCQLIGPADIMDVPYTSEADFIYCPGQVHILEDGTIVDQAGSYMEQYVTSEGCDSIVTVNIEYYPEVDLMYTTTGNCAQNSITLEDDDAIVQVIIDGASYGDVLFVDGLAVGNHTLTVRDTNDCFTTEMFDIMSAVDLEFSIESSDLSFNCSVVSGMLCWANLPSNINSSSIDFYLHNSATGNLVFANNAFLVLDPMDNCLDFSIPWLSNISFVGFDQLLVVVNSDVMITDVLQLDDLSNYLGECDPSNNYYFTDFEVLNFTLEDDLIVCASDYLITGPMGFETYEWSNGMQTQDILVDASDEYILIATDACANAITDTVNIELVQIGNIFETLVHTCPNESNGMIEIDFEDLNPNDLVYIWEDNISNTNIASNLPAGDYSVTVIYGPCSEQLTFTILEEADVSFSVLQLNESCLGNEDGMIEILSNGNITTVSLNNEVFTYPVVFDDLAPGTYELTIVDGNFCQQEFELIIEEGPSLNGSLPDTLFLGVGEDLQLDVEGVSGNVDYLWSSNGSLSCVDCSNPFFLGDQSATVSVDMSIEGCSQLLDVYIEVEQIEDVYIPNVFSPNGDSNNDQFGAFTNLDFDVIHFHIYDRWGNLIYRVEDSSELQYWDGRFKGKIVNAGVYVYLIEFELNNSDPLQFSGTVTVVE